jgi:signal transduction histidine kinase
MYSTFIRSVDKHSGSFLSSAFLMIKGGKLLMQTDKIDLSQVLQQLARSNIIADGNLTEVLRNYTQTAARALDVERVNIWIFDTLRAGIRCIEGFDAKRQQHYSGETLSATEFPTYFAALENLRSIASINSLDDQRTAELREKYLLPHGIHTMLDAPIMLSGEVVGVVCHEHTGSPRVWTTEERNFANSIADFVAISLETDHRNRAEQRELELQAKLLESSKLESLGLFAGSIAHDFNNLVGVILVHTDLALLATQDNKLKNHILEIQTAAEHAAKMCQQLLNYSNTKIAVIENLNLSSLVEEILKLIKVVVSNKAVLICDLNHNLPLIQADAMQLRQLVMNLVTNASDALEDRPGTIWVKTGVGFFTRDELQGVVRSDNLREGEYIYVEVADTGTGMNRETQQKMFEPFFTTKSSGRGLGMATVLDNVQTHKGTIQVQSKPDAGTSIRVLLPVRQIFSDHPS